LKVAGKAKENLLEVEIFSGGERGDKTSFFVPVPVAFEVCGCNFVELSVDFAVCVVLPVVRGES